VPRRHLLALTLALPVTLLMGASGAAADGPSVGASVALVDQVWSNDGRLDVVVTKEPDSTLVQTRATNSRELLWQGRVPGLLGVPLITAGGPVPGLGGLSPDGRTLVLSEMRTAYPADSTRLVVLDTLGRRRPRELNLRGNFAVDALSPRGDVLYLIQDRQASSFSTYSVRAFDLRRGELRPGAIVDRTDNATVMHGNAVARATSPDGGWVYTVYVGGPHAFVHALHASAGTAFCVDLPWKRRLLPWGATAWLDPRAHRLHVTDPVGRSLAVVDTAHLRLVSGPAVKF
jgi:hypothetical protein